jgi:hypothetical protein
MNTQKTRGQASIPIPTRQQLAALGVGGLAYVRAVVVDGQSAFAIFAADGQQIGLAPDRALADAAIVQHEMVPVSVH